jgi:DNA-binding transcriptional MocR family regulator
MDNHRQYSFLDKSRDRKYFTILPNIIFKLDLTVQDIALYTTIKKVAGEEGECFMTTRRLAQEARISAGQVSKSKKRLADRGLIEIVTRPRTPNGKPVDHITITDIWVRNTQAFQNNRSPGEHTPPPPPSDRSPGEQHRSPGELEEDHINKNHEEKKKTAEEENDPTPAVISPTIHELLADFGIQEPNLSILAATTLSLQEVRAWILYVQTQDMPAWRGYLVNRLKRHDPPPPDFLEIATLSNQQLDVLESCAKSRHWIGDWRLTEDALDQAGISEDLADLWYQNCGKEKRQ